VYHLVLPSHSSFNDKELNDKLERERFPTLIDQTLIFNDTSSRLHHFESPSYFKFLKHVESKLHLNNLWFW
jgi:hypothetical protein